MANKSWKLLVKNAIRLMSQRGMIKMASGEINQAELARAVGVRPTVINQIFKFKNEPRLELIESIAQVLGVTPSDLLFDYSQSREKADIIRALDALDPEKMSPKIQGARALISEDMSLIRQRADEARAAEALKVDLKKPQR